MTTNAQGLTFGAWLAAAGVSPNLLHQLPTETAQWMRDDWQDGAVPALAKIRVDLWRESARSSS